MTVVSCDNFLGGAAFKDSIESELEYVNSKTMSVKISVSAIKHGQVMCLNHNPASVHVNDILELQFTANTGYEFYAWSAIDEYFNDASDCVEFFNEKHFVKNNLNVYTVDARITAYKSNLWIVPGVTYSADQTAPEFIATAALGGKDFACARTQSDFESANFLNICEYENREEVPPVKDVASNRVRSLFVKFFAYEADSLLKQIYVIETLKRDMFGIEANTGHEVFLDAETGNICKAGSNLWTAEFEYTLKLPEDGIVRLDFYLIDSNGNRSSECRTVYVYQDTQVIPLESVELFVTMPDLDLFTAGQKFTDEQLNVLFNKFPLTVSYPQNERWYAAPVSNSDYTIEDVSAPLSAKLTLTDSNGKEYPLKVNEGILDFAELPRTTGYNLTLTLTDDLGNEKTYEQYLGFAGYGYSHAYYDDGDYITLYGGTADSKFTADARAMMGDLPGYYLMIKPISVLFYQMQGETDWTYDYDAIAQDRYNYVLKYSEFKDLPFKYYRIRAFRPFNNETEEYETMLQTLASDLVTVKPEDITPAENRSYTRNEEFNPEFDYEITSDGDNTGTCTLTLNIKNWEEKGYESCVFYLEESYSSLDGTYTESTSAQNVLSGIPYGTVAAANKIYVQVYAGSYYGSTEVSIPSSVKPQDNAPPVISIAFGNTNFLGNILNFSASDSNSSVNSSSCRMYYSTVKKERTADEIKELDYLEPSTISGSTYYIPVWKLEEDLFYGYAWAEDTHGNYAYKEFKFDTRYRTGFFEKSSSSNSSRHSSSAVVPLNNKYYNAYYLPSGARAQLSYTAGISYVSQRFNLNVLSGYMDDDDPLTGIFTRPFYYYAFKCEPLVKILDNVTTGKILVAHDAPVLIETYWSEKDFGTDITKWIMHTDPSNAKYTSVYYPAENDTSFSTYTVDSSAVPSGNYYCAIIHFADGSEKISQIWQKD